MCQIDTAVKMLVGLVDKFGESGFALRSFVRISMQVRSILQLSAVNSLEAILKRAALFC
jgi:hypothetical protein